MSQRREWNYAAADWRENRFLLRLPSLWHSLKAKSHPDVLKSDCKPYRRAFETFDNICAADTKKRPLVTCERHVWRGGKKGKKRGKIQTPSEDSLPLLWPIEKCTAIEERPVWAVPASWLGHNHTLKCLSDIVSIKWKLDVQALSLCNLENVLAKETGAGHETQISLGELPGLVLALVALVHSIYIYIFCTLPVFTRSGN